MMYAVFAAVASVIVTMLTPAILIPMDVKEEREPLVIVLEEQGPTVEEEIMIGLKTDRGIEEIPMEEYLIGVVLAEMPASFHLEALKAQAVAARTFAMSCLRTSKHSDCTVCAQSSCCQAWYSAETLEEKMGTAIEQYTHKVKQAVNQTRGEFLTYGGDLIEAVFFSCSGGKTEAAVAVWGNEVPYLQSVESEGEENASKYESKKIVPVDNFKSALRAYDKDLYFPKDPRLWIEDVKRTEGNGVDTITICGQQYTGRQIREIFDLNSTVFELTFEGENAVFCVKGHGHRVGMSQYGAEAMAKEGADYMQILLHYYQNVSIEK